MKLEFTKNSRMVELLEDVHVAYRGYRFTIPSGFKYDGASIPGLFWSVLGVHPFHHKVFYAALIHDYLYRRGYRGIADKCFRSQLKEDGCNLYQRQLMYLAVRLFGGSHASKKKQELTNGR